MTLLCLSCLKLYQPFVCDLDEILTFVIWTDCICASPVNNLDLFFVYVFLDSGHC